MTGAVERPRAVITNAWRHPKAGPVLKGVTAYVVLIELAAQVVFGRLQLGPVDLGLRGNPVPRAIFLNGATIGLLYGLLGMGLILVYRANRIINFAQAQLGSVPAVVALLLMLRKDVNYFLVVPIVLIGGALLGGIVEIVFIRRFRDAPRLIVTVATIGVSLLLLVLEFQAQTSITGELVTSSNFRTPWTRFGFDVHPLRFTGDFIMAAGVTAVVCGALGAFFRFTDMGIAVRASAENGERAALLGIPVRRVSTVVWIIAAVLSATAVFLRAPMVGLTLGSSIGPVGAALRPGRRRGCPNGQPAALRRRRHGHRHRRPVSALRHSQGLAVRGGDAARHPRCAARTAGPPRPRLRHGDRHLAVRQGVPTDPNRARETPPRSAPPRACSLPSSCSSPSPCRCSSRRGSRGGSPSW